MARRPSRGMMKDSEERPTARGCSTTPWLSAMALNMRPSQSGASVVSSSLSTPSLAQAKAAVTALPPKDTA
ncbi:Uncharacterised protein [Bordetella trematum]|nr:Uncharacterised protein [Bordetella trematum]SAI58480.1 Uncharacterised protein [Bordetella trematum]